MASTCFRISGTAASPSRKTFAIHWATFAISGSFRPRVVAAGVPHLITADMVKPGAVVIDVGMNRDASGKLCGDVDFASCVDVAGWITPVPGGVGPMTIAMLMKNTIRCYLLRMA